MTLNLVPKKKRSCHKYSCEIRNHCEGPKSYQWKDMANVKVFADKQMDTQTDGRTKKYMLRNLSMRGNKNAHSTPAEWAKNLCYNKNFCLANDSST